MNEGNCYAYYPYSTAVSNVTQIPVSTAGQVDYMYATPVTVNAGNKEASLKMKHALSAVRFMIKKGSYAGAGQVTAVSVQSSALGTSGSLNAITGELTGVSGQGSTISVSKSLELSTATQDVDVIVVPTEAAADLTLSVTLDGKTYSTVVSGATVTKACCNQYTLTVNVGELALSGVEIGDWGYNDSGAPTITAGSYKVTFAGNYADIAFENSVSGSNVTIKAINVDGWPVNVVTTSGTATLSQSVSGMVRTITLSEVVSNVTVIFNGVDNPWDSLSDGVYAIDNTGKPVEYSTASTAETGTYKGVALVINGKAIEIAKEDASESSIWAETSPMTDEEAAHFSDHYITVPETAVEDMDGKANTQRIIDAGVTIATVINDYNTSNGTTGWYLPSAGQLREISSKVSQINTLLGKSSGTAIDKLGWYWSSTVYSANYARCYNFDDGYVSRGDVTWTYPVRLVRDL